MKFAPELSLSDNVVPIKATADYGIYQNHYGRRLLAKKKLDKSTLAVLRREKITDLAIGSLGFKGPLDLNILKLYPELTALTLIEPRLDDWTPLQHLANIQRLTLVTRSSRPKPLDFTRFRHLQGARISWYPEWDSILSCSTLRGLTIENSKKVEAFDMRKLPLLQELCFKECLGLQRAVCGPEQSLESLGIYYCRSFESLEPLQVLKSLKYVELSGNSRFKIESLGKFAELKRLSLWGVGKIPSIQFLSNCGDLERFSMVFSTQVEDGDLGVLFKLPRLKDISFRRFKNYSHTLKRVKERTAAENNVPAVKHCFQKNDW